MPSLIIIAIGPPAMIDWPTIGVLPDGDAALRVEPGLDRVDVHRPVQPRARVVLAA